MKTNTKKKQVKLPPISHKENLSHLMRSCSLGMQFGCTDPNVLIGVDFDQENRILSIVEEYIAPHPITCGKLLADVKQIKYFNMENPHCIIAANDSINLVDVMRYRGILTTLGKPIDDKAWKKFIAGVKGIRIWNCPTVTKALKNPDDPKYVNVIKALQLACQRFYTDINLLGEQKRYPQPDPLSVIGTSTRIREGLVSFIELEIANFLDKNPQGKDHQIVKTYSEIIDILKAYADIYDRFKSECRYTN